MRELKWRQSKVGVWKSQTVDGYHLTIEQVSKNSKRPRLYRACVKKSDEVSPLARQRINGLLAAKEWCQTKLQHYRSQAAGGPAVVSEVSDWVAGRTPISERLDKRLAAVVKRLNLKSVTVLREFDDKPDGERIARVRVFVGVLPLEKPTNGYDVLATREQ